MDSDGGSGEDQDSRSISKVIRGILNYSVTIRHSVFVVKYSFLHVHLQYEHLLQKKIFTMSRISRRGSKVKEAAHNVFSGFRCFCDGCSNDYHF